jgi:hypothetical protein
MKIRSSFLPGIKPYFQKNLHRNADNNDL